MGRLQADDEAAPRTLRASCDCEWTKKWTCPGFDVKGSKGNAKDDDTVCYDYCCGGNVQQCLKCDKEKALCSVTSNMKECSEFKRLKTGQWKEEKTQQCLDMFKKNKFGLWKCKEKKFKNQLSKKENGKHCFEFRGGKMCIDDASKSIRFRENDKCLVCDQEESLCRKPKVNQGECSDFYKDGDTYRVTNATKADQTKDECLDRHKDGWGLYACVRGNKNQKFSANNGKKCITSKKR